MGEEAKYVNKNPNPGGGIVNLTNVNKRTKKLYEAAGQEAKFQMSGVGCGSSVLDIKPLYKQAPAEEVISNNRNAWIVLGVDRPSALTSGYGGRGATQCAAIDIVAGRMGGYVRDTDENGALIKVNPDFIVDASRIYITQKGNIDEYFYLPEGEVGNPPDRAAIALKSDEIRLVARGGIKLCTASDVRWASGQRRTFTSGIDLIADIQNIPDLQPLVKGKNLIDALGTPGSSGGWQSEGAPPGLAEHIADLREIFLSYVKYQGGINQALLTHTHQSPFFGVSSSPAFTIMGDMVKGIIQQLAQTEASIIMHGVNLASWENNYLNPHVEGHINSVWNNTN
tara:strand:+ start:10220 stop:11236 length:1017 start_codon:yes stop_codon:yes gene_type:complete